MDYEKSYKEALERAKKLKETCDSTAVIGWCEYIFPELKGNEDRKIRNAIYDALKYLEREHSWDFLGDVDILDAYTWLEKQGEQKSVEDSLTLEEFENAFITKAEQYDIDLPNRSWDIYALCKELYSLKHKPKQGEKASDKIVEKAKNEKQRVLLTETNGNANIDWDARSLKDVRALLEHGLDYIKKLEKQGEQKEATCVSEIIDRLTPKEQEILFKELEMQKPANKIEPKFHEGQWITNGDYTWKIVEVKPLDYILQSQDGNIVDDTISHIDAQFHSFTIEDAKDGDVLVASDNSVFIFACVDGLACIHHIALASDGTLIINPRLISAWESVKGVKPATKEQRDLLFQKMKEEGYEWNAVKKQLKKIEKY